jgi:hypothetical protein
MLEIRRAPQANTKVLISSSTGTILFATTGVLDYDPSKLIGRQIETLMPPAIKAFHPYWVDVSRPAAKPLGSPLFPLFWPDCMHTRMRFHVVLHLYTGTSFLCMTGMLTWQTRCLRRTPLAKFPSAAAATAR